MEKTAEKGAQCDTDQLTTHPYVSQSELARATETGAAAQEKAKVVRSL